MMMKIVKDVVDVTEKKVTEFEGFVSGDSECFCLSKIPYEEWVKIPFEEKFDPENMSMDKYLMYPHVFFPEECREGKWKFKITVEAERVD